MKALITGAGGFIGRHLVTHFAEIVMEVNACVRKQPAFSCPESVTVTELDIEDKRAVDAHIAASKPDVIVHLAAQSLPGKSWETPAETYNVNVNGTINLLEAVVKLNNRPRFLFAGSSAEFDEPKSEQLIRDDYARVPNSPYASSKIASSDLVQMYQRRYDLDALIFRPFAIYGPGKTGDVCSDFAERVVEIEEGRAETLRVGDLSIIRDMIDIRDFLSAISLLTKAGVAGQCYNICSGKGTSIGQILEIYQSLSSRKLETWTDEELLRPLEHRAKIGDPSRIKSLGWTQVHDLKSTLSSILEEKRRLTN